MSNLITPLFMGLWNEQNAGKYAVSGTQRDEGTVFSVSPDYSVFI